MKRNLKAKRFEIFEKPTYCIYRSYNCGKMGIEHTINATYGRINHKYASSPSWNKKNKLPCLRTAALNLHANPWKLRLIKINSEIWSEKKDIQKNQNNQNLYVKYPNQTSWAHTPRKQKVKIHEFNWARTSSKQKMPFEVYGLPW